MTSHLRPALAHRRPTARVSVLVPLTAASFGACCPYVVSEYDGGSTGGGGTTAGTGTTGTSGDVSSSSGGSGGTSTGGTVSACTAPDGPDGMGGGTWFCMSFSGCVSRIFDAGCTGRICPACMEADGITLQELCHEVTCGEYLRCLLDAGAPLSQPCARAVASLATEVLDAGAYP